MTRTKDMFETIGRYIPETEDSEAIIEREHYEQGLAQGYIYKNYKAFNTSLSEPCYIPELSDAVYSRKSFLAICDGNAELAEELFQSVAWQHPETLFEEYIASGEYDWCEKPTCGRLFASYEAVECPHCHAPYGKEKK